MSAFIRIKDCFSIGCSCIRCIPIQIGNLSVRDCKTGSIRQLIHANTLRVRFQIACKSRCIQRGRAGRRIGQIDRIKVGHLHDSTGGTGKVVDRHCRLEADVQQTAGHNRRQIDRPFNGGIVGLAEGGHPRNSRHNGLKVDIP